MGDRRGDEYYSINPHPQNSTHNSIEKPPLGRDAWRVRCEPGRRNDTGKVQELVELNTRLKTYIITATGEEGVSKDVLKFVYISLLARN